MTAPAVHTTSPPPAPRQVPAVASLALGPTLNGPDRSGTVLGTSRHTVWIGLDREVVVVSTHDAVRLSNSVELSSATPTDLLRSVDHRAHVVVGNGRVVVGPIEVRIVRWWDSRPALPPAAPADVAARLADLTAQTPGLESAGLRAAIVGRDTVALVAAARRLIGRGPGLTPVGDDYLAGSIASLRCLSRVVGAPWAMTMLDAAEPAIGAVAAVRTTAFSASILRHAFEGHVAAPAGAFLRAIAGRGDVTIAHRRLLDVGHTSGPALAAGIVLGARALTQGDHS